jgi:hypothetical protein
VNRPENVVGSYVVYASENKINWVGGKEYKCGQVGFIYRPRIIDSAGTEVWGDLHIENGILSVIIPQEFLDKAVYPVRHAAGLTFGYTTDGGSDVEITVNTLSATKGTPSSSGTISSYTVRIKSAVYAYFRLGLIETSGFTILDVVEGTYAFPDYNNRGIDTSESVTADTNYYIFVIPNKTAQIAYTSANSGDGIYDSSNSYSTPTNPTDYSNTTRKNTLYATYTAAASGPAKLKTWNGLATAKIKTINSLAIAKVKTINGLV